MSKPGLSLGLSLSKKPKSKPAPSKRKPVFGGDSDDDDAPAQDSTQHVEVVTEFGGLDLPPAQAEQTERKSKKKNTVPTEPPTLSNRTKKPPMAFGDLSGSLTSRKNAEEGEKVDKSIYEYDSVYDSIRPKKKAAAEDEGGERKSRYMGGVMAASAVRKRDQQIAEEKRIAREREAEGEEFADKEKFVTAAYRRQQEENRQAAEEEKRREEEEGKKNTQGGMSGFYRNLLDREDKERAELMKEAEEKAKLRPEEGAGEEEKTDAQAAEEMREKGVSVVVNEDGQVVDKRQLLRGGLNVAAKPPAPKKPERLAREADRRAPKQGFVGTGGGKRAMVERHSRMLEEQLAASLKRSREEEEAEKRATMEKMARSTKTEGDISSARERYLARKREAEEAKKAGIE